jgi:cytochrome c biogenesis protein CcmG/thiol:disulfide interchange protein DsbE
MSKKIGLLILLFCSSALAQQIDLNLKAIDGSSINVKESAATGAILLNFWALWCEPCRAEMRYLNDLYNKYKEKGFTIVGINQDSPKSVAKVRSYISAHKINFPIVLDPNFEIFNSMNGQVLPYSLLIDKNGKIVYRQTGYVPGDEKKIEAEISQTLKSGK